MKIPNVMDVIEEIKKVHPFKGVNSILAEKQFIEKAKKVLFSHGVDAWKIDFAVKDFKKANAGRTIVYLSDIGLLQYLIKAGDLTRT